jgi:hydroxymethylbilane synthase
VAIEVCTNLDKQKRDLIRNAVNHPATEYRLNAERAFLKTLKGGCSIPAFCTANYTDTGELKVHGGIISLDGTQKIFNELHGPKEEAAQMGHKLAQMTLDQGGAQILAQIHAERDADTQ